MPYLNIKLSVPESADLAEKVVAVLMKHTTNILGKKPEVTSIQVDFVSPQLWFVNGIRMAEQQAITFYLDIKITEGTNTKSEKAKYIKHIFNDMEAILGKITPASYIVIHDVRADAWGFQGHTQEYRFIQSQTL